MYLYVVKSDLLFVAHGNMLARECQHFADISVNHKTISFFTPSSVFCQHCLACTLALCVMYHRHEYIFTTQFQPWDTHIITELHHLVALSLDLLTSCHLLAWQMANIFILTCRYILKYICFFDTLMQSCYNQHQQAHGHFSVEDVDS